MAGHKKDEPGYFAQLIAAAIRREMGDRRMSGRSLATRLGRSEKYARERLAGTFEFTLNDIENFCLYININPESFIARIEQEEELRAKNPTKAARESEASALMATPDEGNVGSMNEDQLKSRYDLAANHDESHKGLDPDHA